MIKFYIKEYLPTRVKLLVDALKIFARQATYDAHKLYFVPKFDKSLQRLTTGNISIIKFIEKRISTLHMT